MQSIIIISKDKEKSDKYISDLCKKEKIGKFDVSFITGGASIGIGEVRKIKEVIFLTPGMGNKKAVIIEKAELLTHQAQNALLKTLEEPPDSTFLILISDTVESFLPTVISRCGIIKLTEDKKSRKLSGYLNKLLMPDINTKLKLAQDNGKTKETALEFIEEVIREYRSRLGNIQEIDSSELILTRGQKIYTILKTTNVNPRLALESFLLQIL